MAAFYGKHPHFDASFRLLERLAHQGRTVTTLHSITETYAGITRLPIHPRATPQHAKIYIDSLKHRIKWIPLDRACYDLAMDIVTQLHVPGAKIYDALIAAAAKQNGESTIYTWNVRDFELLAPAVGIAVRTPDAH